MKYNHVDTIYYKSAKKLLHASTKMMQPEKLGWVINLIPELTNEDMGFEITPELRQSKSLHHEDHYDSDHVNEVKRRMPATKFEAVQDDLLPEEILSKSQIAAREARAKLCKRVFLVLRDHFLSHLTLSFVFSGEAWWFEHGIP